MINPLDILRKIPSQVNTGLQNAVTTVNSPATSTKLKAGTEYLKKLDEEQRKKAAEKAKQDALLAAQKTKEAEAAKAQEAKSIPFQLLSKVGDAYNFVKPAVVEAGTQTLNFANPVSNPIINGVLNTVGVKNPVGEKIQEFNRNYVSGALNKTIEQPAQGWTDALLNQRVKAQTQQNRNIGDYINDLLGIGSATGNVAISSMPIVAGYNAITGGLQGNKETKALGDAADAISSAPSKIVGAGVNQLPVSDEAKQAITTLVNLGLASAGTKAGKGIQKRINDVGYRAELMNSLNKNIAREGATFSSGPNFNPIIKALVDAEKKMVNNPVVQALDPTGITTGAAQTALLKTTPSATLKSGGDFPPNEPPKSTNSNASIPSPEEVGRSLNDKLDNLIQKTAGYTIKAPEAPMKKSILQKLLTPVTKVNDIYTGGLRKFQDFAGAELERGLTSGNVFQRKAAATLQSFFRGAAMSPEREAAGMKFKGGLDAANTRAYDVMDSLYSLIGKDKKSLEKINAVLDPEIAKTKVSFEDLSTKEQQAYGIIREGLDLVHDISYSNGNISPETYAANQGKYTPRMYNVYELPEDIAKAVKGSNKKLESDLYKSREGVDSWKMEESLNDPVYSLGKRLAQVESNRTIKQYIDYIKGNNKFVSDVEKPGYTKMGDSKAYGDLAGKYVLNNIAEDFKGFFFSNEGLNKIYDLFKSYDSLAPRQLQKKALTVYNPTTHLGNVVSDNVFGFMVGVDPLTLNKNVAKITANKALKKQLSDYLTAQGILGTSVTRGEFTNKLKDVESFNTTGKNTFLDKVKNVGKKIDDTVTSAYGGTDDIYKMSAFQSLLDQGKSLEEATRLVSDGFQNYSKVGKFYDVYAKTPLLGSAFVKFQGDLLRMIKNAAVNRPAHLIGFLAGLKTIADISSAASGETPEDKKARETRFGTPYIPLPKGITGVDAIPLTWQTPIGEINVARYISPFSQVNLGEDATGALNRFVPFGNLIDASSSTGGGKERDAKVASIFSDPFLGPLVQATITGKDFRGKSILDPNENQYQGSTATPEQKNSNRLNFLRRSYTPAFANSIEDTLNNLQGNKDYYGKERSPMQAIARLLGVKIETFGKDQVKEMNDNNQYYEGIKQDNLRNKTTKVINDKLAGKITEQQANEQLNELQKEADFNVFDAANISENKKLTEQEKTPKTAAQIKSQLKTEAKTKVKQSLAEQQVQEMISIIKSNNKESATKILKEKYPKLTAEAIKKLFIKAAN